MRTSPRWNGVGSTRAGDERPVRDTRQVLKRTADRFANAGLVYYKFPRSTGTGSNGSSNPGAVRYDDLTQVVQAAARSQAPYRQVYRRWSSSAPPDAVRQEVYFSGPVAMGLGHASVLEIGFTFHPVYGVPYIPGSSLKGLTQHFTAEVLGARDPRFRQGEEFHRLLFGSAPEPSEQGAVIFFDALILPDDLARARDTLRVNVITPHQGKYYVDPEHHAPHGMADPVPVYFLSLYDVRFLFMVAPTLPDLPGAREWTNLAMRLLLSAVQHWGVGAKTRSGFGRGQESTYSMDAKLETATSHDSAVNTAETGTSWCPSGDMGSSAVATGTQRGTDAGRAREIPASQQLARPQTGQRVRVTRVEDPSGKGRPWFRAVDQPAWHGRLVDTSRAIPDFGEVIELEVQAAGNAVNWRWPQDPKPAKTQQKQHRNHGSASRKNRGLDPRQRRPR
ncbi:MAG: type III-B CRISPR module RAMP protein Cmr6 [Thermoflavifilum sp.]|nr:type III-B CRISPR module RAMP protein Cmr6 [Thermoflavifilum sp.]MCL6515186.1 type III-B CRISPR module RAMP protein Cmr6 [Alicyclobacillus sp.]